VIINLLRGYLTLCVCFVKRLKLGTTTGLLSNRSLIFDVLKAWYIDWLPLSYHQKSTGQKRERKKEVTVHMGGRMNKMNVIVEELINACIQMRFQLNNLTNWKEKETLILKHIRQYENSGVEAYDFPKGIVVEKKLYKIE